MRRLMLLTCSALALGCDSPFAMPDGAVPFVPDRSQYVVWWREVEACSGLRGDYDNVAFYIVPGAYSIEIGDSGALGLWLENGNRIVLPEREALNAGNVRHEMLHSLLKLPGHPAAYFNGVCDALVD